MLRRRGQRDAQRAGIQMTAPPPVKRRQTPTPRFAQAAASTSQSARWKRPITTAGAVRHRSSVAGFRSLPADRLVVGERSGGVQQAGVDGARAALTRGRAGARTPARCRRRPLDGGAERGISTVSGSDRSSAGRCVRRARPRRPARPARCPPRPAAARPAGAAPARPRSPRRSAPAGPARRGVQPLAGRRRARAAAQGSGKGAASVASTSASRCVQSRSSTSRVCSRAASTCWRPRFGILVGAGIGTRVRRLLGQVDRALPDGDQRPWSTHCCSSSRATPSISERRWTTDSTISGIRRSISDSRSSSGSSAAMGRERAVTSSSAASSIRSRSRDLTASAYRPAARAVPSE